MLSFKISWRFLWDDKWQSLFIILGIGVGVAAQIFVGLIIDSLQANLIESTVGKSAHIRILPAEDGEKISQPEKILLKINNIEAIKKVQLIAQESALASGNNENSGILFKGINIDDNDIFGIKESLVDGKLGNSNEVLIGIDLAEKLSLDINDNLQITDNKGEKTTYKISGIFDVGVAAINENWVISSLKTSQRLFGIGNKVNEIDIQIADVFSSQIVSEEILNLINDVDLKVVDWQEENEELLSALSAQSGSSFMIQFFVLLSVVIAITSVLSITVMQKQKQIGILKAMGLKNNDSMSVFLLISFMLGFAGSLVGLGLGFLFFTIFTNATGIFEPVVRWGYVLATILITTMAATFAGFFPGRRSAKLDPIEIIQNE